MELVYSITYLVMMSIIEKANGEFLHSEINVMLKRKTQNVN